MNQDNLIPLNERTKEEQREITKKGGIASGEARRRNKSMQELTRYILSMSLNSGESHTVEEIQSLAEIKGKNLSVDEAIIIKQVEKALKGDLQSATFVRDTSGQKPVEKQEVNTTINDPFDELSVEELKKLANEK